jgi:hypothetical protein
MRERNRCQETRTDHRLLSGFEFDHGVVCLEKTSLDVKLKIEKMNSG